MGLQIVLRVLNLFGLGRAAGAPPVRFGRAKSRAPYWALWAGLMLVACAATAWLTFTNGSGSIPAIRLRAWSNPVRSALMGQAQSPLPTQTFITSI